MVIINVNFINDNINVNLLNAVINEIYINAVINAVINDVTYVLTLRSQDSTWQINIGIHSHTQTHWTPLMDAICAVINGVN